MSDLLTDKEMWAVVKEHEAECRKESAPLENWEYIPYRARLLVRAQLAKDKAHFKELLKHRSRPELREKINYILIDFAREIGGSNVNLRPTKDRLLLLYPDEQEVFNRGFEQGKFEEKERIIGKVDKMITQLISQGFVPTEYHSFLENRWESIKKGE